MTIAQEKLIKDLGKRILSEANDLKRTVNALANDIGIDKDFLMRIINGECELKESYEIIRKMGTKYPIDIADLYLLDDDCEHSVKIMSAEESFSTNCIIKRVNKNIKYKKINKKTKIKT